MRNGSAASISSRAAVSSSRRAMEMLSMKGALRTAVIARSLSQYATQWGTEAVLQEDQGSCCKRTKAEVQDRAAAYGPPIDRRREHLDGGFFQTCHLIGLWAFCALDDVELDLIPFFQALIAFALNGAVMNEYVCPAIAAEEAVTLCVVEPLDCALVLCHRTTPLRFRIWGDGVPPKQNSSAVPLLKWCDANCAKGVFRRASVNLFFRLIASLQLLTCKMRR